LIREVFFIVKRRLSRKTDISICQFTGNPGKKREPVVGFDDLQPVSGGKEADTAGSQYSFDFGHHPPCVGNVLVNLGADDHIETLR